MSPARTKVVWITPSMPDPEGGGGSAHEFELLRGLSATCDLRVLSCCGPDDTGGGALEALGIAVTRVAHTPEPPPRNALATALTVARSSGNAVLWLSRGRIPLLVDALRRTCADDPPDLVHVTQGDLAPVADGVDAPTTLLLFDALSRVLATRADTEVRARRRLRYRIEAARTRRWERQAYAGFDAVASVSSVDAAWFAGELGREVEVLENPIPSTFTERPDDRPGPVPGRVTFVGALGHRPNLDAVEWFARDVWPTVRTRRPEARFHVVGRAGGDDAVVQRVRDALGDVDAVVEADVDDIRPSYWDASVVVAPVRYGAGLRNKVLHAMACGAPVVATPAAVEGVPVDAVASAWIAADASSLADAVVEVLGDPGAAERRARRAADALADLRSPAVVGRMAAWWEGVIDRGRPPRRG